MPSLRKTISAAAVAILLSCPFAANAQQFGLQMGETVRQIKSRGIALKHFKDGWWETRYLPYGNKAFESYTLLFGKSAGLCKMFASTSIIEDSGYGDTTKRKYDGLKEALTQRYGAGTETEYLRAGAIWKESHEWMRSLSQNERNHSVIWATPNDAGARKNLAAIELKVVGLSPSESMVFLTYEFNNFEACQKDVNTVRDANL
jgi:hypothetical protein